MLEPAEDFPLAPGEQFAVVLDQALACAAQQWPEVAIMLSAQCDKQAMYARRGFVVEGEPYDDGGVWHVTMRRAG